MVHKMFVGWGWEDALRIELSSLIAWRWESSGSLGSATHQAVARIAIHSQHPRMLALRMLTFLFLYFNLVL